MPGLRIRLGLVVGELGEQPVDLRAQALVERVAGGGNLGQEDAGPAVVTGAKGRQSGLVQAQGTALLGEAGLGDQLVGLGVQAKLPFLGLGCEQLGGRVVAAGEEGLGFTEQLLAAVPGGLGCRCCDGCPRFILGRRFGGQHGRSSRLSADAGAAGSGAGVGEFDAVTAGGTALEPVLRQAAGRRDRRVKSGQARARSQRSGEPPGRTSLPARFRPEQPERT